MPLLPDWYAYERCGPHYRVGARLCLPCLKHILIQFNVRLEKVKVIRKIAHKMVITTEHVKKCVSNNLT